MDRELRIGFVGCGTHATQNLYPALPYASARLVSVCDLNSERCQKAKRIFGAEAAFSSVSELLDGPPIDAVLVCGPPELHESAAVAAVNAGLHVFVEKPPSISIAGAEAMRDAALQNGRICAVGFMKRFSLRYQHAREIAQSRTFGKLTHVFIKYAHWNVPDLHWMMSYMSIHALDLARYFAGDIDQIAFERRESNGQYTFSITASAKGGVLVTLLLSSQEPRIKEHVELTGEGEVVIVRNVIELEYHRRVSPTRLFTSELHDIQLIRPDLAIPNPEQNSLFFQGYAGELSDFVHACLTDRAPGATIDDGISAMRLCEILMTHSSGRFEVSTR